MGWCAACTVLYRIDGRRKTVHEILLEAGSYSICGMCHSGVRNHQARNIMQKMRKGNQVGILLVHLHRILA